MLIRLLLTRRTFELAGSACCAPLTHGPGVTFTTCSPGLPARSRTLRRASIGAFVAGFHAFEPVPDFVIGTATHSEPFDKRYSNFRLSRSRLSSRTSHSTPTVPPGTCAERSATTGACVSTHTFSRGAAPSIDAG